MRDRIQVAARRACATTLFFLSALLVGLSAAAGASHAASVLSPVPETGSPGLLSLATDSSGPWRISPGEPVHWRVRASLADQQGSLRLRLVRQGELVTRPDGLHVMLQQCSVEWTKGETGDPRCPSGAILRVAPRALADPVFGSLASPAEGVPADAPFWDLGVLSGADDEHVLVTLWLPRSPESERNESLMALDAEVGLYFLAAGAVPSPPEPPAFPPLLPITGSDPAALGLLVAGVVGLIVGVRMVRS